MPPRPSFSIWSHPRTPTYKTYIPSIRLIANSALTGIRLPTHPNTRYLTRRELRQITTSAPTTAKKTISMPSQPSKQTLEPEIISSEDIATDLKWVKLRKINWRDEDGKDRCWEAADRTTQPKNGIDAVAIFAILDHPSKPLSTIIIEQFRPPVGKYVVEFPAGLVDEGESAENTALRELHEETGYGGGKKGGGEATLESMTPLIVSPSLPTPQNPCFIDRLGILLKISSNLFLSLCLLPPQTHLMSLHYFATPRPLIHCLMHVGVRSWPHRGHHEARRRSCQVVRRRSCS